MVEGWDFVSRSSWLLPFPLPLLHVLVLPLHSVVFFLSSVFSLLFSLCNSVHVSYPHAHDHFKVLSLSPSFPSVPTSLSVARVSSWN